MMATADLLPPNATVLERAIDVVDAARTDGPQALIGALWDPDTCPAALLGYLAWSLSVDIWDDSWDDLRKRDVCRRSFQLHRLKTTPAGIRAHLELAGARVRRFARPPSLCFARAAMTDADREAWLAALPQIRIYPFITRGVAQRRWFAGGSDYFGHGWLRPTRGPQLLGKRAAFYDRDVETPLGLPEEIAPGIFRVSLPGRSPRSFFAGRCALRGVLRATVAERRFVTFRIDANVGSAPIDRGLTPMAVHPARMMLQRGAPVLGSEDGALTLAVRRAVPESRAFSTRFRGFLSPSFGPHLLVDRISLQDPARMPARRRTRSYYGRDRFAMPAFTAQVDIAVPMRRARARALRWHGVGYLRGADMTPLDRAIEAVSVSKAARDTILIDTTTVTRPIFGNGLRFGEFVFGQRMRKS